ncbi:MAG: DUF1724 domain-containing protein [Methanosarcinaceae archaeon]|nr:DUF1724 domain-containing protein [Methanosarcinaceae archaeon]
MLELLEGDKHTNELIKNLGESSVSLLPQIKRLVDEGLIVQNDGICSLTMIGELIIKQSETLIRNSDLINKNIKFWSRYDLSDIPDYLLGRLYEIGKFDIIEVDLRSVYYEPNPYIDKMIKDAKFLRTFTTMNQPEYVETYYNCILSGCNTEILFPKALYDILKSNPENVRKKESLPENSRLKFIITSPDIKIAEVTVTDEVFMLTPYPLKESLDYRYLISKEKSAIKWGNDLIDHIKSISEPVPDIKN